MDAPAYKMRVFADQPDPGRHRADGYCAGRTLRPDQGYGDDVCVEEALRHGDLILLRTCPPPLGLLKADVGVIDGRIASGLFHAVGKN